MPGISVSNFQQMKRIHKVGVAQTFLNGIRDFTCVTATLIWVSVTSHQPLSCGTLFKCDIFTGKTRIFRLQMQTPSLILSFTYLSHGLLFIQRLCFQYNYCIIISMNFNLADKYWIAKLQLFWHSTFDHRFILSILNYYFLTVKLSDYNAGQTPALSNLS